MANNTSLTRTYDRVFTIMRDEAQPVLWDNISARTALLFRMRDMGAITMVDGEPTLRFNILKELPTAEGYTDLDTSAPVRPDPYTSAVFEWKQIRVPVQVSGLDMIKTGDGGIENMLNNFLEAAEVSMRDGVGGATLGLFSAGGDSDLDKITGLQTFLTTSNSTGTVGLISRASQAAWRHQVQNISGDFSLNGLNRIRTIYRQCRYFDSAPDTIVATGAFMDNFEGTITNVGVTSPTVPGAGFRFGLLDVGEGDRKMLDAGFANIRFKNAVMFDDDGCPANFAYVLNLAKYVKLMVRRGRDAEIGDFIRPDNADSLSTWIYWAGNLVMTGLRYNGVLLNGDTI